MSRHEVLRTFRRPISSVDQSPGTIWRARQALGSFSHRVVGATRDRSVNTNPLPVNHENNSVTTLIIVPPFAPLYVPSLAAHTLQSCAAEVGHRVHVVYANIFLAGRIGKRVYDEISLAPTGSFIAERLFARWAFDLPPLGHNAAEMFEMDRMFGGKRSRVCRSIDSYVSYSNGQRSSLQRLLRVEASLGEWLDELMDAVKPCGYKIVGCTSSFAQNVCSLAILNRVKKRNPTVVTVIGGANCDGEMADGIRSVGAGIDYIFSGESDHTFPKFLLDIADGRRPNNGIIVGRPCEDLDSRPTPRFDEFLEQREHYLPSRRAERSFCLMYETSRGCWWGQKQHCTFCGLNPETMASRRKSATRVLEELKVLTGRYPIRNIAMSDPIMPHEYFSTLLPQLSTQIPGLTIFYEEKANLTLPQVLALKEAGITTIQPGIESLSSHLLEHMKKGVQAWQNLLLLRYARIAGVRLWWSILCGFPGDLKHDYTETLQLVRMIHHLPPPITLWHLIIDRFSPYFRQPEVFGLRNISPYPAYFDFLPATADISKLAYHFTADYESAADQNPVLIRDLAEEIRKWRTAWQGSNEQRPELRVESLQGRYVLIDTRRLAGTEVVRPLTREEAAVLSIHRRYTQSEAETLAVQQQLAVVIDGWFVPLAVTRIDHLYDLLQDRPEMKMIVAQLEQLGSRKRKNDARGGLLAIARNGYLSALENPFDATAGTN